MSADRVLTSGDVAKALSCSPRLAQKYMDQGILVSYRLPGSAHRRVLLSSLRKFMTEHGIPEMLSLDTLGKA